MMEVGEMVLVAQVAVGQDLRAMFRGAIRASWELFLEAELEALVGLLPSSRASVCASTDGSSVGCCYPESRVPQRGSWHK